MIIEQIQIGSFEIFCYILGDPETGEGIVIDPGGAADPVVKEGREPRREQDKMDRQYP